MEEKVVGRIEILSMAWDLILVDRDNPLEDEYSGTVKFKTHQIFIDNSWSIDYVIRNILHEIIHVIDHELKLELDEPTIVRLSAGLWDSGIINKDLYEGIIENKKKETNE